MPCSGSTVRRVPAPPQPSGRARWRLLVFAVVACAAVLYTQRYKLHSLGSTTLTTGPADTYVFANRSAGPCLALVSWGEHESIPIFLPPRSTTDFKLPLAASGMTRTDVWHVLPDAPAAVEHVLEWSTVAGEEFAVSIAADGSETHQALRKPDPSGNAFFSIESQLERPLLVFYEDLEAAGGVQGRDDDGRAEPVWVGAGVSGGVAGTGLDAGRQVHVRYRVPDLRLAASVKIDSRDGTSHEIVIASNGSAGGGSLSLLTRAGF